VGVFLLVYSSNKTGSVHVGTSNGSYPKVG